LRLGSGGQLNSSNGESGAEMCVMTRPPVETFAGSRAVMRGGAEMAMGMQRGVQGAAGKGSSHDWHGPGKGTV
jgi:hypothetical protein